VFIPELPGSRFRPLPGARFHRPFHNKRGGTLEPAHAVPIRGAGEPTDVSNYCPIWRLPGPANFWARQRRNNRSIVCLYITARSPRAGGRCQGPASHEIQPPPRSAGPPNAPAVHVPSPQPCKPPARSPADPEHPLTPHPGDGAGSPGAWCCGGGGGTRPRPHCCPLAPPQQGGGRGHREGAAGGLPVWAAAADRDLGTCLCHGRDQGCWYVELAAASLQAGGEPRPAAGIVPLLGIILNPPRSSSSRCGHRPSPGHHPQPTSVIFIPLWELLASNRGHHPHPTVGTTCIPPWASPASHYGPSSAPGAIQVVPRVPSSSCFGHCPHPTAPPTQQRIPTAFPLPSLPRKQPTVLVVCGPAQNGAIGLVCARHLRIFDYEPTIFYPKRSPDPLYRDFTTQCEKMDIPFLSYLPTEVQLINDAYNAVVDAVLGAEAEAAEGREPCAAILATLKHVRIPIVSLDVPSGPAPCSAPPSRAGWDPPTHPSPVFPIPRACHPAHHGITLGSVPGWPGSPRRALPGWGQPWGAPALPPPRPPEPGSIPARSQGWRPLSVDAFRASTINNKLLELR
uniref:YjeF N-terminal domain-containing protein n=1 Tax=Accipiter nisus TaxID=211598 RepID=A0A8B9MCY1_9AVES